MGKMNNTKRTVKSFAKMGKRTFKVASFLIIHWYITLIVVAAIFLISLFFALIGASDNGNGGNHTASSDCPTASVSTSISGTAGTWTKKGTKAYNLAKNVYTSYINKGYTAAGASGSTGNVMAEGGLYGLADTAQGRYGSDDKTNGLAYGNAPIDQNGGGLYQFSPFQKFAPLGSKKWLDVQAQTNVALTMSSGGHYLKDLPIKNAKSPSEAAYQFGRWEEGDRGIYSPPANLPGRKNNAQKAYDLFSSIKGSNGGASDAIDSADSGADAQANACGGGSSDDLGNVDSKDWVYPLKAKAGIKYGQTDTGFNVGDQSFYGTRTKADGTKGQHDGFDFGNAKYSDPIRAAHSGKVIIAGRSPFPMGDSHNSYIVIKGGGLYQVYQEFGADGGGVDVKKGQNVNSGQKIAHFADGGVHTHVGLTTSHAMIISGSFSHDSWTDPIKFFEKVHAKKP